MSASSTPKNSKRRSGSGLPKNSPTPGFTRINVSGNLAASPHKNLTGSPRHAKDLVADIYNNIQHWNDQHLAGAEIVKQISILKSNNLTQYTPELEEQTNRLYEVVQKLRTHRDKFQIYVDQIKALADLEKGKKLFFSMTVEIIAANVQLIFDGYSKEFETKEKILETIPHTKHKDTVVFLTCAWTYQCYITKMVQMKLDALLLETGLREIK